MSDTADKINENTKPPFNKDAVSAIGHILRLTGENEKLRAALKQARRDALEEAARRLAELHRNHKYNPQTGEGSEHDAGYYRALSEGAAWICALGEKDDAKV